MWSYPSFGGISFTLARGIGDVPLPQPQRRSSLSGGAGVVFSRDILIFYTCPSRSTHLQTSVEVDQIIYSRLGFGVRWKSQTRRGEALGGDVSIDGLTCSLL
jgi:hypothetical protein